jgi:hypothetical protein
MEESELALNGPDFAMSSSSLYLSGGSVEIAKELLSVYYRNVHFFTPCPCSFMLAQEEAIGLVHLFYPPTSNIKELFGDKRMQASDAKTYDLIWLDESVFNTNHLFQKLEYVLETVRTIAHRLKSYGLLDLKLGDSALRSGFLVIRASGHNTRVWSHILE